MDVGVCLATYGASLLQDRGEAPGFHRFDGTIAQGLRQLGVGFHSYYPAGRVDFERGLSTGSDDGGSAAPTATPNVQAATAAITNSCLFMLPP